MKILVFGIHPDDVELGCGGTVAMCAEHGHEVTIVDLSQGESSSNGTPEERAREAVEAARILGCTQRLNLGIPDAAIQGENIEQQKKVVSSIRLHRPHLVLLPLKDDPHPDHAAGAVLIERAIYFSGIHGYQTGAAEGGEDDAAGWTVKQGLVYPGRRDLDPDVIVDISNSFQKKMDAVLAHRTQFDGGELAKETPLNQPDFLSAVEARARWAGHLIGVRYGEPFKTIRKMGIRDLSVFS